MLSLRNLLGATVLCGLIALLVALRPADAVEQAAAWWKRPADGNAQASPSEAADAAPTNGLRVLFVGNSHTFYNDLPLLVARLASAAEVERPLDFVMLAPAGQNLAGHLSGAALREQLAKRAWHFVVLQEQQQRPTFTWSSEQMERDFYAPVRTLDVLIRAAGARTILYMTAARRHGDPGNRPGDSYEAMQERSRQAHQTAATQIGGRLAPVGLAFRALMQERPDIALWQPDGSHPSLHGSYLAACVLFETLYERSPLGNAYTAGLSAADALALQRAAAATRAQ